MAADAYIKTAAAQLMSAAQELQNEARQAQVETYDEQRRLEKEARDAEHEKVTIRMEMASTEDAGRRQMLEGRLHEKDRAAADKLSQVNKKGSDAADAVNAKTALANQLRGMAAQLESMAASAR